MATIYKVWGWDTFAHESYSCGEFYTYDDALRQLKRLEAEAERTQDEGLRDTFSIQTTTEAELREEEQRQAEFLKRQLAEQKYDRQALRRYLQELLSTLTHKMATFDVSSIQEEYDDLIIVSKDNLDNKNCFHTIQLTLRSTSNNTQQLAVDIKLFFPTTKDNDGGSASGRLLLDTVDNIKKSLLDKKTLDEVLNRASQLVGSFYK